MESAIQTYTKHKMSVEHHHFLVLGLEISGIVTGVGFIANRYKIGDALLILVVNAARGALCKVTNIEL